MEIGIPPISVIGNHCVFFITPPFLMGFLWKSSGDKCPKSTPFFPRKLEHACGPLCIRAWGGGGGGGRGQTYLQTILRLGRYTLCVLLDSLCADHILLNLRHAANPLKECVSDTQCIGYGKTDQAYRYKRKEDLFSNKAIYSFIAVHETMHHSSGSVKIIFCYKSRWYYTN